MTYSSEHHHSRRVCSRSSGSLLGVTELNPSSFSMYPSPVDQKPVEYVDIKHEWIIEDSSTDEDSDDDFSLTVGDLDIKFRFFVRTLSQKLSAPYIHDRLLYFPTTKEKRQNAEYSGETGRTYSYFWNALKADKNVQVTICSSLKGRDTNTWGAALLKPKDSMGFHLLIYECDLRTWSHAERPKRLLPLPDQRVFWRQAKKHGAKALWYQPFSCESWNVDTSIQRAIKWVTQLYLVGDITLAGEDARIRNFVQLA